MAMPMLVVDKNVEVFIKDQAEWLKYGVPAVRVDTMQEAIEKLSKEPFLFTAINADNVNYRPLLKILRETAPTLIFIITSNFKNSDEVNALKMGADVYTNFKSNIEDTVQLGLAQLLRCGERNNQPKPLKGIVIYDKFLVVSETRQIFCTDIRLKLTTMEYNLLHYLITNHDITLTYKQIYQTIWGNGYDEAGHGLLWNHIRALRKKITHILGSCKYIENEKGSGYCFSIPYHDK